jgi:hypothetical protein
MFTDLELCSHDRSCICGVGVACAESEMGVPLQELELVSSFHVLNNSSILCSYCSSGFSILSFVEAGPIFYLREWAIAMHGRYESPFYLHTYTRYTL